MPNDIIEGEFKCPLCGLVMDEKRPSQDKHLVVNKERVVRLRCVCGHYEDKVVKLTDFKADQ